MRRRQALARLAALPALALGGAPGAGGATSVVLPPRDVDVVGRERTVTARRGESLVDVARRYRVGQDALRLANPTLPRWLPLAGRRVLLPLRHVLPAAPREGLVINLPERRLYDYASADADAPGGARLWIYPVSIGRVDTATPLGTARIVARRADPSWTPPASIRAEALARGRPLPARVPPGPDNPLGRHALYLDRPGYLLHGTNDPDAIGLRVTHGCVRLYPAHVAALFRRLPEDAPVRFVDEPLKLGWQAGRLLLEVYPPLPERAEEGKTSPEAALALVAAALEGHPDATVDRLALRRALARPSGRPTPITRTGDALPR